jgi:Na+/phosphate symporter
MGTNIGTSITSTLVSLGQAVSSNTFFKTKFFFQIIIINYFKV